ncbi:MAG: phosphate uptake regulator PhoU [Thaumarchaeota archaeon]|nr:phosphate uptake regulator PhoU [Nitrososphaerota archaeon]
MEVRKLQTTAAGTFIVTIPKDWVSELGLEKGGLVYLEQEEGDIVLSPVNTRPAQQSRPLRIDKVDDERMLELSITASYMQGHDITEVISKERILPERKGWIRHAVDNLVGVEIAEEYSDRVVLQNLVDPLKFDLAKSMERFSATSLAVLADAVRAFAEGDTVLAQDAYQRGHQSTRFYRLLMRLGIQVVRNRRLRDEMNGSDIDDALMKIMAIKELGRTAYYAMRVAQHVLEVEKRPEPAIIEAVTEMATITGEMQQSAFDAFMKKDLNLASGVIARMDEVRRLYDTIGLSSHKGASPESNLALGLVVRGIRGVAGYAVALADDAVLSVFG